MKRIRFLLLGFTIAMGLLFGAPGMVRATTTDIVTLQLLGLTAVSNTAGSFPLDVQSLDDWSLFGRTSLGLVKKATISEGSLCFTGVHGANVSLSGKINGTTFTLAGTTTNYVLSPSGYYSWVADFPNVGSSELGVILNDYWVGYRVLDSNYRGGLSVTWAAYPAPPLPEGEISTATFTLNAVPIPASAFLLVPGLLGLFGIRKRVER